MMGGESGASGALLESSGTPAGVSGRFVLHGGGDSVTLGASGGTILVDLVISNDVPVQGFFGRIEVDAASVVRVNSSGWTARENILSSAGLHCSQSSGTPSGSQSSGTPDPCVLSSYYDMGRIRWSATLDRLHDGEHCDVSIDPQSLLDADLFSVEAAAMDLAALDGWIETPVTEGAQTFATADLLGSIFRLPLEAGQAVAATLSLQVAGAPGGYQLGLTEASYLYDGDEILPMNAGAAFTIVVGVGPGE
jgi:hypothetical protein